MMESQSTRNPEDEENLRLPLVNTKPGQQDPRPQIIRSFSRDSTGYEMPSPTKAFSIHSCELEPENSSQEEQEHWGT